MNHNIAMFNQVNKINTQETLPGVSFNGNFGPIQTEESVRNSQYTMPLSNQQYIRSVGDFVPIAINTRTNLPSGTVYPQRFIDAPNN